MADDGVAYTTCFNECLTNMTVTWTEPAPSVRQVDVSFRRAMTVLNVYATPLIVLVGVVTNTLATCVFLCTPLRRQSSSVYLAALAVVDSGFLFTVLANWFSWLGVAWFNGRGWCQTVIYVSYVCGFLSVWYLLAFTVERYIAVCHPIARHVMCSTRRARIVTCALSGGALVGYSFAWWTSTVVYADDRPFCFPDESFAGLLTVAVGIDGVLTMVVPSLFIVLLNLRIGIRIYNAHRYVEGTSTVVVTDRPSTAPSEEGHSRRSCVTTFGRVTCSRSDRVRRHPRRSCFHFCSNRRVRDLFRSDDSNQSHTQNVGQAEPPHRSNRKTDFGLGRHQRLSSARRHLRTTRLLFIVSAVFLVLNAPSHAVRTYYLYRQMASSSFRPPEVGIRLQECFQFLYYINFSVNFFLYSFGAKRFRAALKILCRQSCMRVRTLCKCMTRLPPQRERNGAGQEEPESEVITISNRR